MIKTEIGHTDFVDMIMIVSLGRRCRDNEKDMTSTLLVTVPHQGVTPSPLATRLTYMGAPEAPQAAVAAGLLGAGSVFLGAMQNAAAMLHDAGSELSDDSSGMEVAEVAHAFVAARLPLLADGPWPVEIVGGTMYEGYADPATIRATVDRYLAGLEAADFDAVAACFAEDAFYSHPPFEPGAERAEARGREAILALLRTNRRARTWFHEVTGFFAGEGRCAIETRVREYEGGPVRSDSAGVGTFDVDGLITRWVAYRSDTEIGGTLTP